MRLFLLTTFLIFLVLQTYSTNIFTSADPNETTKKTITDELINNICSHTVTPSFCVNNLKPLKGKRLYSNPVAVLGTTSMNQALSHGNSTAYSIIWARYRAIEKKTGPKYSNLRLKLYTCFVKYTDIYKYLVKAKKSMASGDEEAVKEHTFAALKRVFSCDDDLAKVDQSRETGQVTKANMKFEEICSVIVAICDEVHDHLS